MLTIRMIPGQGFQSCSNVGTETEEQHCASEELWLQFGQGQLRARQLLHNNLRKSLCAVLFAKDDNNSK